MQEIGGNIASIESKFGRQERVVDRLGTHAVLRDSVRGGLGGGGRGLSAEALRRVQPQFGLSRLRHMHVGPLREEDREQDEDRTRANQQERSTVNECL